MAAYFTGRNRLRAAHVFGLALTFGGNIFVSIAIAFERRMPSDDDKLSFSAPVNMSQSPSSGACLR
ncbi:MAG TPA: hypothetical protein VG323_06020, partial [Thermoanaerobaculia bacterium]|nr:hypothetical protein [Thermoanaerobaculia bacterium]